MDLAGKVVLVTGATGGIGQATARRLASSGARLALAGRDRVALDALARDVDGVPVPGDLTLAGAPESLVSAVSRELGPISLLVNNAGRGRAAPLVDISADEIDALLRLDLIIPTQLARLVLPMMLSAGEGRIVFIGSIAGLVGVRDEAVYSAAKGGLARLADGLYDELAGTGVGITLVSPGAVATNFFARRGREYDRRFPKPIPAERVATAIVRAVLADRSQVLVPRWLSMPALFHEAFPGLYRRLSARIS